MKFIDQLEARWTGSDTMLCVGLDPNPARLPKTASGAAVPVYDFCRDIIDATADTVCAFKPQFAYFAAMRELDALERLTAYIHERHPGIPVILDAKRGDIGSTARAYAVEAFEVYGADAVTLSPYMGFDTVEPYLEYEDKGVFLLCRTSNPGGADIEMLQAGERKVFEHVAANASERWNTNGTGGRCDIPRGARCGAASRSEAAVPRSGDRSPGRRYQRRGPRRRHIVRLGHGDQFKPGRDLRRERS